MDENQDSSATIPITICVNPRIISTSPQKSLKPEACLSVPGYISCLYAIIEKGRLVGLVERHESVTVEYAQRTGKLVRRQLFGLPAHIFQHELVHINVNLMHCLIFTGSFRWSDFP